MQIRSLNLLEFVAECQRKDSPTDFRYIIFILSVVCVLLCLAFHSQTQCLVVVVCDLIHENVYRG